MSQTLDSKRNTDCMDGSALPSPLLPCTSTAMHSSQTTRKARSKIWSSIASAELSFEDFTDHDEFARLASMRAHRLNNIICNSCENSRESRERLDTLSEFTNTLSKEEQALNLAVWEVIDREIKEWQKVCGTGRPSWWSPVTKRSRVHQAYASSTEDPLAQSGETTRLVTFEEPLPRRSRALSESSLPQTTKLNDLAYLIAVQLLSACFTLPPEQIPETAHSAYHYYDTHTEALPDPKLISALRMHTHFRYTPSFGHQARNNSIANPWENKYDGYFTPNILTAIKIMPLGFNHKESRPRKPKRCVRRPLNTTEASSNDQEGPSCTQDGAIDPSEIPLSSTSTAWNRRKGIRDSNGQEMTLPPMDQRRINISLPPSPNQDSKPKSPLNSRSIYTHQHRSKETSRSSRSGKHPNSTKREQDQRSSNVDGQQSPKDQSTGSSRRALESQIRSEPHPVFIQPVKELVVKRWRTFRSRFAHGGSSPDPNSTSNDFMVEGSIPEDNSPAHAKYVGNLKLKSLPGLFTPGSAVSNNNDGKERRRRARKASEIHSGSSNETPTFNTPASENGGMSDGLVSAMDVGRASPTIHLLDPLGPTPSSEGSTRNSSRSSSVALPDLPHQDNPIPRSQSVSYSPRVGPPPVNRGRRTRKSMLSEMHTLDTYDSPAIELSHMAPGPSLSQAGSAVQSSSPIATGKLTSSDNSSALTPGLEHATMPFDDATPGLDATLGLGSTPLQESPFNETPGSVFVDWSAGNVREQAVKTLMENDLAMERAAVLERERESIVLQGRPGERPRMIRMSTSGTACFTPNEDGVEVDGLPVGPRLEEAGWNVEQKGEGRKLRESSFL